MAKKTIYFDSYCGYDMFAVTEGEKITDFGFEKKDRHSLVGNIYKGRVESVLPGMNAVFVNCGLERNCYLSADDILPDAGKYDGADSSLPSLPNLKEGDEIAVQIVKPPVGKKGARVTAFPTIVGKNLIYMPLTPFVGVSRKIADEELRKNLIYSAKRMISEGEGIILRTSSPYAKRIKIELELSYIRNLYAGVAEAFKTAKTGALLYTDVELPMRVMRDTLSYSIEKIVVGNRKLETLITQLVNLYPPEKRFPVYLKDSGRDMFGETGLSQQISALTSPRADLDNGAYLVVEKTEALTVVDVNTGSFTGGDNLEETVYYTNILAAREVARQVKLRNIGGIVVVDFIDMHSPAHEKAIVEELERALKTDSAKCSVLPMSEFGLVEFTRKRTGTDAASRLVKQCRHCRNGYTLTPEYILFGLRAELLNMYADGARKILVDLNDGIAETATGWSELIEDLKSRLGGAEVYLAPHKSYAEDRLHFTRLAPSASSSSPFNRSVSASSGYSVSDSSPSRSSSSVSVFPLPSRTIRLV